MDNLWTYVWALAPAVIVGVYAVIKMHRAMRRRMEVNGGVILRVTEKFALLMVLCACWALRDPLFLVDHGALRVLTGWVIVTSIVLAPVIAGVFFLPLRAMYRNSLPDAKS